MTHWELHTIPSYKEVTGESPNLALGLPEYVKAWATRQFNSILGQYFSRYGPDFRIKRETQLVKHLCLELAAKLYLVADREPEPRGKKYRPFKHSRPPTPDIQQQIKSHVKEKKLIAESYSNEHVGRKLELIAAIKRLQGMRTQARFKRIIEEGDLVVQTPLSDIPTLVGAIYEDLNDAHSDDLLRKASYPPSVDLFDALLQQHVRIAHEKMVAVGLSEQNSADMPPEFIEGKQYGPEEKQYTLRVLNDARHLAVEGQLMNNCVVSRAEQLVLADQEGDAGFTKKRNMLVFSLSVELPEPDTIANVRGIKANDIPKERRFADATFDDYKVTRASELTFEYDVWTGRLGEVKRQDNKPFPTDESDPLYQAFFEVLGDLNEELKHRYRGRGIQSFGGDLQHLKPKNGGFRTITNDVKTLDELEEGDIVVAGETIVLGLDASGDVSDEKLLKCLSFHNVKVTIGTQLAQHQFNLISEAKGSLGYTSFVESPPLLYLSRVQGDLSVIAPNTKLPGLSYVGGDTSLFILEASNKTLNVPSATFCGELTIASLGDNGPPLFVTVPRDTILKNGATFAPGCVFPDGIPTEVFENSGGIIRLPQLEYEKYKDQFPDKVRQSESIR